MPITDFLEHVHQVAELLNELVQAGHIGTFDLQIDQRSTLRGFVKGQVHFKDGAELHFREFIDTTLAESKMMYAYRYQNAAQELVFRYDNAVHRPPLTGREHKHTAAGIIITSVPTLEQVLNEILG
ncbi:MAG: DUF6516 family protein [Caldilineaceae bacterium]